MSRHYTQRGFSLVELAISVQFAAILALISGPMIRSFFANYQLTGAANQLGFEIARARMRAVAQNRFVRVRMTNATHYVCESSADGSSWANATTTTLPSGVTSSTDSAEVRFDKRGLVTVNESIVVKNTQSKSKTIATSIVGRVTITNTQTG